MRDFDSDDMDGLLVEVRASTRNFAQDIAEMRGTIDHTLVDGFARAGNVLERGLLGAIRKGSLGFSDLRRIALNTINEIAVQTARNLFTGTGAGGSGGGGGIGGLLNLSSLVGPILGLPGRATGGPVSPGRGYIVGERGPELFVPAAAGRVETMTSSSAGTAREYVHQREAPGDRGRFQPGDANARQSRDVRVAINVISAQGASVPQSLRRSSRQVASAVRRAIAFSQ